MLNRLIGGAAPFAVLLLLLEWVAPAYAKRPLTVADAIETTRIMPDPSAFLAGPGARSGVLTSPSGTRYVVFLVRGDLDNNGNWLEVLTGRLDAHAAACRPRIAAKLVMSSLGGGIDSGTTLLTAGAGFGRVEWLDDDRIAVLWGDERNVSQVYAIDLENGRADRLTQHPTNVLNFAFGKNGTLLYAATAEHDPSISKKRLAEGFIVSNWDLLSLLAGHADGKGLFDLRDSTHVFALRKGENTARRIVLNRLEASRVIPAVMSISPNAKWAIVEGSPEDIPAAWDQYTEFAVSMKLKEIRKAGVHVGLGRTLSQLFAIDLDTGKARPLIDAPNPFVKVGPSSWSPDGEAVVLTHALLPTGMRVPAGLTGNGVVEVSLASRSIGVIPVSDEFMKSRSIKTTWLARDRIVFDNGAERQAFRKQKGAWLSDTALPAPTEEAASARVAVEVREDMNTPPTIIAVDPATRDACVAYDPNPRLISDFALGRAERIEWTAAGSTWTGRLYYPSSYSPKRKYPLVVQTHGHGPDNEFSLYGMAGRGLGPGTTVNVAQPLANRGFVVLQVQDKFLGPHMATPEEPKAYMAAYEEAIKLLDRRGLIDVERVGIAGFSRTGWHVAYALQHSAVHYAAAIVTDNTDPSYIWTAALGWPEEMSNNNGAPPFGRGLEQWLKESLGFNAEKIRTPLRLQQEAGGLPGLMLQWEMFSRLRYLNKPVEFYVVPDIEHGSHALQNPRQLLASQQGAVEWFDFWLNGNAGSTNAAFHENWRGMRTKQCADADRDSAPWYCRR